ncbi:hypothetical protein A2442_03755 [Candidatus Campbellbacteria bacterium RIFOXYC2_FULL_35_25]|uniref:Uncharacterized protein n=1 Tax=Candidatus Campbellbacteria bacterium RIFOXYC2_FULL_35_25 TaxID=1797582 RepID=A0A1F5EJV0_9BACT|nr:MAG: hypothetical protein A2442_03755 [Candidatus Campbellbacteria bacterium RIFOXYC2_FULL_35_25]
MVKKEINFDSKKIKHLEFIQDIIERMIKSSFLFKGWCLTVLFSLITFSNGSAHQSKGVFYAVILSFFLIDVYFAYKEESYINLYNKVRTNETTDFSLKIQKMSKKAFTDSLTAFPNYFFYLFLMLMVYLLHL